METVQLSTQLVNAILQYLGQQPFTQVVNLINGIQTEASKQNAAQQAQETSVKAENA
jgi:hypothetical protein